MARKILWSSLALTPLVLALHYILHVGHTTDFGFAAAALVPLAWVIGEATEHAAEHTGPGIGGFLNASFGNAPELIIALFAVSDGLLNVVRGSLAGSVIGNLLLVLGFAVTLGPARLDLRSLVPQVGLVVFALLLFLIPSVPGFHGNPDRHALTLLSIPVSIVLLLVYIVERIVALRRHAQAHSTAADEAAHSGWGLKTSLVVLGMATVATAVVSEIMVGSIDSFAHAAGLSQFFVSAIIVAIVGNAAEHGGAVVIATRGKLRLASEIAVTSGAQVALLVTPVAALLSFAVTPAMSLAFRWEELAGIGIAAAAVAIVIADGRGQRREGFALIGIYLGVAVWYFYAGDR